MLIWLFSDNFRHFNLQFLRIFFIAREFLLSQAHFKNYFYLWSFIVKLWGYEGCPYS